MRLLRRAGAVALLAVLGVAGLLVGLVGAFFHGVGLEVIGVELPVGVVLCLLGEAAVLVLAGLALRNRLAVLAPAVGWLLPVFGMSLPTGEGDLVVGATGSGYSVLLGGAIVIGLCIAMPYGSAAPQPRPPVRQ